MNCSFKIKKNWCRIHLLSFTPVNIWTAATCNLFYECEFFMNPREISISETLISFPVIFLSHFFSSSICHTCLAAWWFWIMLNNSPSAISCSMLQGSAFRSITLLLSVFHVCYSASLQDQTFHHGFILLVISRGIEALWSFVICVCNMTMVWMPFSKLFYSSLLWIEYLLCF